MSGDIGIEERAIILIPQKAKAGRAVLQAADDSGDDSGDGSAAANVAQRFGGRVSHHYGPSVVISEISPEAEGRLLKEAMPGVIVADSMDSIPADVLASLDPLGLAGLRAFHLRQSAEYAKAKANRPFQGEPWENIFPASGCVVEPVATGKLTAATEKTYCKDELSGRLSGRTFVSLVFVSGPGSLGISAEEEDKAFAEIQNGLGWLGSQNPKGNISWVYKRTPVLLDIPDDPKAQDLEGRWRKPTMQLIEGDSTYPEGIKKYLGSFRKAFRTDWAYLVFITRYSLTHFAYAIIGNGPYVVMNYDLVPLGGPDNMDRSIAHETGHVFHAPDEYASSGCNCTNKFGYFQTVNGNCINCFSDGKNAPCIMCANEWAMCKYTPWQVGYTGSFPVLYPQGDTRPGIGGYNLSSEADLAFPYDFDGSGKPDHLVLYRPGEMKISIVKNDNGNFTPVFTSEISGIGGYLLDSPADRAFAYDFDSSGKLDHLVLYQPVGRKISIIRHDEGTNFTPVFSSDTGIDGYDLKVAEDQAFAFDFDSSGKLDHIVLYRPRFNTIFVVKHNGGQDFTSVFNSHSGIGGFNLDSPADRVFAFDFEGTGKRDHLVLYRPAFGVITILKNSGGDFTPVFSSASGIGNYPLDSPADRVFAYDYNGSCKLDHLVLYRPAFKFLNLNSAGLISIVKNDNGVFTEVFSSNDEISGFPLDSALIQAFPFDYSGNGILDNLVFYRPGSGSIVILNNAPENEAQPT
jgi:hypothetical protein